VTRLEQKRLAPDLRAWGQAFVAGAMVTVAVSGGNRKAAALLAAGGAVCYYVGVKWE